MAVKVGYYWIKNVDQAAESVAYIDRDMVERTVRLRTVMLPRDDADPVRARVGYASTYSGGPAFFVAGSWTPSSDDIRTMRAAFVRDDGLPTLGSSEFMGRVLAKCVDTEPPDDPLASPVVGPCWTWTGLRNECGYGRISYGDKDVLVHRGTFAVAHPLRADERLDHLCRNRACCNPAHLEIVTQAENVRRGVRVALPRRANLTEDAVREARRLYAGGNVTLRILAERFGVKESTMSMAVSRKTWPHIE